MDDLIERYRRRAERFELLVSSVPPNRWDDPSPCAAWTARDVVKHIVEMHEAMLRPVGRSLAAPWPAASPLAAFASARDDVLAGLVDPELAAAAVPTPTGSLTYA